MSRFLAILLATAPALASAEATQWKIDPAHAHASFTIRHLVISNVRGEFQKVSGSAVIDDKDVSKSAVEATFETASIDTRVPKRDDDLRSANFFDAAKYPTVTFKSTKVEKAGDGKLKVTGDLTMHGVTKPVVLHVNGPTAEIKDPWGMARRGIGASTKLDRRDWGLTYSKMIEAGPVVGNDVAIEIEAELVKQADSKTATK